jgi:hypothetical protein
MDQFIKPTFEKFFNHEELMEIAADAATVKTWDFNEALADTIREKFEALYVALIGLNNDLLAKGAKGYFWIASSPEVLSIIETMCHNFTSESSIRRIHKSIGGVNPQGLAEIYYCGSVNNRWRMYADTEMSKLGNQILIMGCNDTREPNDYYGRLRITNYVI